MGHHEKCGPQEVFLGNTHPDGAHFKWLASKGLSTMRTGKVALDIDGKAICESRGCAPLFIHRAEADRYDAIMMERTFGPHWRRG